MRSQWRHLAIMQCWWKPPKHLTPTPKDSGGGLMIWACFPAICPTDKSWLGPNWILQQNNDCKHSSKSTAAWLKKKRINVLQDNQSPDLKLIDLLWQKKRGKHREMCIRNCPQSQITESNIAKSGPKFLYTDIRHWYPQTKRCHVVLLLLKLVQVDESWRVLSF